MKNAGSYVLGLDLGVSSIGWAAVRCDEQAGTGTIVRAGVRIFEPGMEGDISAGRADSRNLKRRQARQARRQNDRRKRRMRKLLHRLQAHGLLPGGEPTAFMPALDKQLLKKFCPKGEDAARFAHLLPYVLRKRALDEKLEPHELGRAIYHLAQRRGYQSNKKIEASEDEKERGKVAGGISELEAKISQAGARTLGEYFAGLHPEKDRIRSRWTSRQMFIDEFNAVMDAQAAFSPDLLNETVRKQLRKCIFDQRPLKSVARLIGFCEHEADQRRAPWCRLEAQRYRVLQRVLDTRVLYPDGTEQPLSAEQIQVLKNKLDRQESLAFTEARRLLQIKDRSAKLNWEEGGEKKFKGNTTSAKLFRAFGDRWFELDEADRRLVVEDVHSFEHEPALEKRGRERWGLSAESAVAFSKVALEPDYCRLSMKAIRKLLPLMEGGTPYATAVKEVYGEFHKRSGTHDLLPPVQAIYPSLLNPVVNRVLNEVRKVVNAVVSDLGKPSAIRVELARDMKKTRKQRQEITARNRKNETKRNEARLAVVAETGADDPGRGDIVKYILAEECGWECPYTGKKITPRSLFGPDPQFDVDHIIPFSRSLDDSFVNKTLCDAEENRNRKLNCTPWEAYGADTARYNVMLQRVKMFKGDAAKEKLRRFLTQEVGEIEDWASQQLNDTRYATTLAVNFLGLLYGGREDESGTQRVFATRGGATGYLRGVWRLNSILNDGGEKSRDDHRHHAVDAIAVALTTPATIRMLSMAAAGARLDRRHLFARTPEPWNGFWQEAKNSIAMINVSHKPNRKVTGALHEETCFSPPRKDDNGKEFVRLRVPLAKLSKKEIGSIVDPAVRELVRKKLEELGGDVAKFKDAKNHPVLVSKDGSSSRPIHKVRVRRAQAVLPLGENERRRYAASGSNHHMEIVESTDSKGKAKWEGRVVTTFEAMRRLKQHEPVVRKDHGPRKRFICSIGSRDMATIEDGGETRLIILRSVWEDQAGSKRIEYGSHTDARSKKERTSKTANVLRQAGFQKVTVTPLGGIEPAND